MSSSEKFCLRWNDFENNISHAFQELRDDKDFFDVTLACDDDQVQAHKVILSACSPFFRTILRRNHHSHPLLYLKGVKYADLLAVLNFMYHGEVNVAQEELNSFLAVAEDLKVKGLTQNNSDSKAATSQQSGNTKPRLLEVHTKTDPLPQPKRPRPAPPPASRAAPASYHHDDDIQEVVPVKTEPVPLPPDNQTNSLEQALVYSTPQVDQMATGVVADPNMEYGEEYDDYETGYEGQDDGSYGTMVLDNSMQAMGGQEQGSKDVERVVKSYMRKTTDEYNSPVWECLQCGKITKQSTNLKDHIEANHIPGLQFECPTCLKISKTRACLRLHMRVHK